MNKEIKEPPPQAIIKTVIIPKDPYCSCIVVSEDSIILSYTLYILILNIITHPIINMLNCVKRNNAISQTTSCTSIPSPPSPHLIPDLICTSKI